MTKKMIVLILTGLFATGGVITAFVFKPWYGLFDDPSIRGNTGGNLVNWGHVAKEGDWIYYEIGGEGIYKAKTDGTGRELIVQSSSSSQLNVLNEWVYYCELWGDDGIYRIRADGTDKKLLSNKRVMRFNIVGSYIYYIESPDFRNPMPQLYKMRIDGKGHTLLTSDLCDKFIIEGDWAYYGISKGKGLYKVRTNGKDRQLLSDDDVEDICYWDGFIYYTSRVEEERNIWKIRTDGSGRELVSSDSTYLKNSSINVSDGWIYYRNKGDKGYLYKMRTDGSDRLKLNEDDTIAIHLIDDWVYYAVFTRPSPEYWPRYRIRTDGTGKEEVK